MKIEDIHYDLPTAEVSAEGFDRETWRKEHPIDYFKLIYVLFKATGNAPADIPRDAAMRATYSVLYSVTRMYLPDTLYKFYSLTEDLALNEKKLETLQSRRIFLSDIKDFNDPFDGKAFYYDPQALAHIERLRHVNGRIIDDFTAFHKGTALTENGTSCMPMWAHYAANHQGFCVAYDMKDPVNRMLSSCTFPMQYTGERLDITSLMKRYAERISAQIDRQSARGIKKIVIDDPSLVYVAQYLCNVKHVTWQYEREFRCTCSAIAPGMPYVSAMPKAIYLGMKCKAENRERLTQIADALSVPVYQMRLYDLADSYTLVEAPQKV